MESSEFDAIKASCSQDWKELRRLQTELSSLQRQQQETPNDISSVKILQEHERRCKAELTYLKENPFQLLPEEEAIQKIILQRNQQKSIQQLKETVTYLRAKRQDLLNELEAGKKQNEDLQKLNSVLKEKVSAIGDTETSDEAAMDSLISEITEKLQKVTEMDVFFKQELKTLITTRFPLPTSINSSSKVSLNDTRDFDLENAIPLTKILSMLIERTIKFPSQPYVQMDDKFWPPFIELLLKSRIILKDPNNSNRIRLVPFHM